MDTNFSHLLGDIRQPVLVLGDDPENDGNVLVAPFQPAQSVPAANVYDAAVDSPTDTVDDGGKVDTRGADPNAPASTYDTSPTGEQREDEASTSSPNAAQPAAPSGDQPAYVRNDDGSYTRQSDGARGFFGPDGFTVNGGQGNVAWGG